MSARRAVIIGGGLGGLAIALRLVTGGWRVVVCEQGPCCGGKMNTWRSGGFSFDTGPSLLTLPHVFAELFSAVGERLEDHLKLQRIQPLAEYRYPDGLRFHLPDASGAWSDVVREIEPRDVRGVERLLSIGKRLYAASSETFLRRPPLAPPDLRTMLALRHVPLRYGWGNYGRTVAAHLHSPHLRSLFNRYPTYVGSSPHRAPATLLVIPFIETAFGGWYIDGGLYRLVEVLVDLAVRRGVELRLNAAVNEIVCDGGRASAVRCADGARLPAHIVVMNADTALLPKLLPDLASAARFARPSAAHSMSGFVQLCGTAGAPEDLGHHTVCFSSDYDREFDELAGGCFPTDPTVYVNLTSRTNAASAPHGADAAFVMANAPAIGAAWTESDTQAAAARVAATLRSCAVADVTANPVVRDVWSPDRFEREYGAVGGAIYGGDSHGWRNAFLRPSNRSSIRGLYCVGGAAHPGGGTPMVLLSAKIAAEQIARHETRRATPEPATSRVVRSAPP